MEKHSNRILVTGCSSGFGFLIARSLLARGHVVFAGMRGIDGRNADAADRLEIQASETNGRLHLMEIDVTDTASVNAAVGTAIDREGRIDVAVNNAGYGVGGFAETVTESQLHRQMDVNVVGVQRVMRAVLPGMRNTGSGLIINISSVMGRLVLPFAAAYTASKYALEGFSESYRYELSGTGVDVVLIEPGGFGTDFLANMDNGADTGRLEDYGPLAELPDKMWGSFSDQLNAESAPDPQLIADAVVDLVETPAGGRPFRTVIDPLAGGEGAKDINRTTDRIQSQIFEDMGLKALLSV